MRAYALHPCNEVDRDPALDNGLWMRASRLETSRELVLAELTLRLLTVVALASGCAVPLRARAQQTARPAATRSARDTSPADHPTLAAAEPTPSAGVSDEAESAAVVPEAQALGVAIPLYDPSGHALDAFHGALRRAALGEGQARVVVYGASHVASDFATGTLRTMLQDEFGDAGHGFVLPVHPWRYYHHVGIEIESRRSAWTTERVRGSLPEPGHFGLMGVALTTSTRRAWGRVLTGHQHASKFELYYWRQPGGGTIEVRIDGRGVRQLRTRAPESGPDYETFVLEDGPHVFELHAAGDGPVTVFGLAVEREVPGVVVDTLGINGARASVQLQWDEALWREHLRRRSPDLVVLAYGTNESGDDDHPIEAYEASLTEVVERLRNAVPAASCMLIGPSDRPRTNDDGTYSARPRTAQLVEVQQRVAATYGCGFFDLVSFGGGPLHMLEWAEHEPAWAQRDLVHYTYRGYQRLGEVLHDSLLAGYRGPRAIDPADAVMEEVDDTEGSRSADLPAPRPSSPRSDSAAAANPSAASSTPPRSQRSPNASSSTRATSTEERSRERGSAEPSVTTATTATVTLPEHG